MRSLMATINKHKMKQVGSIETLSWSFMTCSGYLSPCCEMQLVDCTLLRRIFLGTKPPRRRATSNLHECTLNKPNSIKQHNNVKEANQKDPANLSITALKLGTIDARHVNMSRPTGEVYETPTLRLQIPLSLSLFGVFGIKLSNKVDAHCFLHISKYNLSFLSVGWGLDSIRLSVFAQHLTIPHGFKNPSIEKARANVPWAFGLSCTEGVP